MSGPMISVLSFEHVTVVRCRFCQLIWYLSQHSIYGGHVGRWEWSKVKCHSVLGSSRSVWFNCIRLLCRPSWLLVLTGAC